jgi:hypothetical protein
MTDFKNAAKITLERFIRDYYVDAKEREMWLDWLKSVPEDGPIPPAPIRLTRH